MDEHEVCRINHLILERARQDVIFKKKILALGKLADQVLWESNAQVLHYEFEPLIGQIASEIGLFKDLNQSYLGELIECIGGAACQLSYLVQQRQRLSPGPIFQKPLGYVFLSWTVQSPRDRECFIGIKNALDWFAIDYFDHNENEKFIYMETEEIKELLKNEVAKSQISIEAISSEAIRPWIQFERPLIDKNDNIHRILVCLEWEKAYFFQMVKNQEARCTRIDMSGGRGTFGMVKNVDQWMNQAGDTSYFKTSTFLHQCYELASFVRKLIKKKRIWWGLFPSPIDFFIELRHRDSSNFVRICLQQREIEAQLADIRKNINCKQARIDDLIFNVPARWWHNKENTGHWLFRPFGRDQSILIRVRFFNVGQEGMGTSSELMHEIEAKALERQWILRAKKTRKIIKKVEAIDVVAEAKNGVSHRFINFYYNGLEYFIEIKTDTSQSFNSSKALFDTWLESFRLR